MAVPARVLETIDQVAGSCKVAAQFAKILVGLFPTWFEFRPEHFAVLGWGLGVTLVVSGPCEMRAPTIVAISTSDSRNMACSVLATYDGHGESARVGMHYEPHPQHSERARQVIALALRKLFPDAPVDPDSAAFDVGRGVFPAGW